MDTRSHPFWPMRPLTLLLLVVMLTGCGLIGSKDDEDETVGMTAEKLYNLSRDRMESGYFKGAIEYYEILQKRFPFGAFSQQAQLDLAYCYYKSEEPATAIAALERFLKLYPRHPHTDYAFYLRGLANFNRGKGLTQRYLPTDASQRDQGAALQSFQDFSDLIKQYPESKYIPDSKQRMVYLRNILARHEVNVANYYMRREAYVAAANRARYVIEFYQQTPAMPDALVVLVQSYKVMEMDDLAQDALRVLELNYPEHPRIAQVRSIVIKD